MTRGWSQASRLLGLVFTVAVLAGCGVGEGEPPGNQSDAELGAGSASKSRNPGGATRWVHTVRSAAESDAPVAVEQDEGDNVLTLGNHRTPIDFGEGPVGSPAGASVLALSKRAPQGELLWVRLLEAPARPGTSPYVRGHALAVEPTGHLLLLGLQSGGLDLGGGALPPGAFLARLDTNGNPLWARALPTTATKLLVSKRGDITLSGVLTGRVDFGNGPVTGLAQPFLVRYDSGGKLRWVYVDSTRGVPMDLAHDDAGDIYLVGGRFLPPTTLPTPFLSRLSPEGQLQWTRQLEGASGLLTSVAAHGDHVVVSGSFMGSFIFRDKPLEASANRGFVLAYSRDMGERWGFLLGSTSAVVTMDQGSGVLIAGRYARGEDFGLGELAGYPGPTNLYVLRLHRPTGRPQWIRTYPSASALQLDLSATRQGESTLVGTFRAPVDFGTGPLNPAPGGNTFLLQLAR